MSDDLPERPRARLSILPFDSMSVGELETYIGELRAEIARAEQMIGRKKAHLGEVDRLFGKPPS